MGLEITDRGFWDFAFFNPVVGKAWSVDHRADLCLLFILLIPFDFEIVVLVLKRSFLVLIHFKVMFLNFLAKSNFLVLIH